MPNNWVHKASELAGEERVLVERLLGRALSDDETISVSAYKPHAAPVGPEREALRRQIMSQAREIGEEEADAVVDQALADIRRKPA